MQLYKKVSFLDAFVKLRKVTIRFVMYGRSSPRPQGTARLSLDGLYEI
jgi:hypothetical protein